MKFYTLAAGASSLVGTTLANLSPETCFANPFNDQLFDIWSSAVVEKNLENSLNSCHSYSYSGVFTYPHNKVWQQFKNHQIVDFIHPNIQELVPLKLAINDVVSQVVDNLLSNESTVKLLSLVNQVEKDFYDLFIQITGDYFNTISAVEFVNWDAEDVTLEELINSGVACFSAILKNLDAAYFTKLAVQGIEILEPSAEYATFLEENPEYLENLVNHLLQLGGNITHMFFEWMSVQGQVDTAVFEEMYQTFDEASKSVMNSHIFRTLENFFSANMLAWENAGKIIVKSPEPKYLQLKMTQVVSNESLIKLQNWISTYDSLYYDLFNNDEENSYTTTTPSSFYDYQFDVATIRVPDHMSYVDDWHTYDSSPDLSPRQMAELEQFAGEIQGIFMDKTALRNYQFQLDHVLKPINNIFGQKRVTALVDHLATVDQLPELAKTFVQSDVLTDFIDYFLDSLRSTQVMDTPSITLSERRVERYERYLPEDGSNVLFNAVKDTMMAFRQLVECEDVCQAKFL